MSRSLAAMVGGAIGALAFLMIVIWFLWYCIFHRRILANRSSETGSSDPPTTGTNSPEFLLRFNKFEIYRISFLIVFPFLVDLFLFWNEQ